MIGADRQDLWRWLASGAVVVTAHIGGAVMAMNWTESFAVADPPSAIVIDLSPIAAAPPMEDADLPPGPQQEQSEAAPDKENDDKPEETETAPETAAQDVPELPEAEAPEVPMALAKEAEPEEKPVEKEKPAEVDKQAKEKKKRRSQQRTASAPTKLPQRAETLQAPVNAQSLHSSTAVPNWKSLVAGILQRNKRYPSEARSSRAQGTAVVRFSVNRGGQLVGNSLVRSSGVGALDQEALALVRRSSPFPPPPPEIGGSNITLNVPVHFNIR